MLSREFKKIYHPRMERYVYKHRGNGLIVDKLMKPMKSVASKVFKTVAKPFAKKAIKAGVSQAGTKVGKMAADKAIEKSGKLITKRLLERNHSGFRHTERNPQTQMTPIASGFRHKGGRPCVSRPRKIFLSSEII